MAGCLWLSPAYGGQAVRSGREPGFWTEWHRALVVARVRTEAAHVDGAESKVLHAHGDRADRDAGGDVRPQ